MRNQIGAHRIIFGSDIIRGPKEDPDGAHLTAWIDLACGLAETYEGDSPVLSEDELELFMVGNATRLFQLEESS
jgi:predicted TIM-barrel fold metal-dependent hydrolase